MSNDFDVEPVRGLPALLPPGETMLWQGAPGWKALLRNAFHGRVLGLYFLLLVVWCAASGWRDGNGVPAAANASVWAVGLGALFFGLLTLFAWLIERTTVYTITNRRVVMRFGIALPMTINLPYALVDTAGLRLFAGGFGDMALAMRDGSRISYAVMWPHIRPWRLRKAQPMLRSVPDAERVALILSRALSAAAEQPAPARTGVSEPAAGQRPQAAVA